MALDLPTLMVMQSFALASAGAVLLFAWLQNRDDFRIGVIWLRQRHRRAGILSLMLGVALHQPAWSVLGGCLLPLQSGLIWKAARNIELETCSAGLCAPWADGRRPRGWSAARAGAGHCPSRWEPHIPWPSRRPYGTADKRGYCALAAYHIERSARCGIVGRRVQHRHRLDRPRCGAVARKHVRIYLF